METLADTHAMQRWSSATHAAGLRIGLVPTMGFLHEGHLSLVRTCRPLCDRVVLSIYVNPTQFAPGEDLASYPRDLARDLEQCRGAGVDAVFCPDDQSMYAADHSVFVTERTLSRGLCGSSRPSHFTGVLTVVAKLFHIVNPNVAVFGRKDYQQLVLIQRMVRDLNFAVEVHSAPTVREPDGLAMSSRNRYLAPADRAQALCLHRALQRVRQAVENEGIDHVDSLRQAAVDALAAAPDVRLEYLEFVHAQTLQAVERVTGPTAVLIAARVGSARLIDNILLRTTERGGSLPART